MRFLLADEANDNSRKPQLQRRPGNVATSGFGPARQIAQVWASRGLAYSLNNADCLQPDDANIKSL
jgi:predicted lipoprotein